LYNRYNGCGVVFIKTGDREIQIIEFILGRNGRFNTIKKIRYDYFVVHEDTISLFIDGAATPFETIGIDELLKKASYNWECE